jgi:hypothetical protein
VRHGASIQWAYYDCWNFVYDNEVDEFIQLPKKQTDLDTRQTVYITVSGKCIPVLYYYTG